MHGVTGLRWTTLKEVNVSEYVTQICHQWVPAISGKKDFNIKSAIKYTLNCTLLSNCHQNT